MKETRVLLHQCKVGDILTRDVVDIRSGIVLCSKGYALTEESLTWLNKFVCSEIYIEEDSWDKVWKVDKKSVKAYEENKETLKGILNGVADNKQIEAEDIKNITESFIGQLNSNNTIMGCVNRVKTIDEYTYAHSMNVGMLAVAIGKWLKLSNEIIEDLFLAGILHDVGKYKLDFKILNKKGPLTRSEFEEIKKHVEYGVVTVKGLKNINQNILEGVSAHHERVDGSGYPKGLKDTEISLLGKILAIADTYDAMISERVYKKKVTPFVVMEEMFKEGFNKLDANILLTFLSNIAAYYIGVEILLSDGQIGEVVFIHPQCVYRPMIRVGDKYIDLYEREDLKIKDIL